MVDASRTLSRCWQVVQVIVNSSTACRPVLNGRETGTGSDPHDRRLPSFRGFSMLAPVEKTAGRNPAIEILSPET